MTRYAMLIPPALLLAACGTNADNRADDTALATLPESSEVTGVERQTVERETAPVERVAVNVMASQPGPDGTQVDLISARVTGDILTLTFRCSSEERYNNESFNIEQVSVIDDSTSQRIGVLKDDNGNWLASETSGRFMRTNCGIKPGVMWARFPAPPATSPTISISLPQVGPFDGIAITR